MPKSAPNIKYVTIFAAGVLVLAIGMKLSALFFDPESASVAASADGSPTLSSPGGAIPQGEGATVMGSSGIFHRVAGTPAPKMSAQAAIILDPQSSETLFSFNAGMRWPIASLTKLMTAHIILSRMDLTRTYRMAPSDFEVSGSYLTRELQPGGEYSGRDLFSIMLVSSSNEAAEAFARYYGRKEFIAAMNAEARTWGFADTVFADPSGLAAGNQSTPKDLSGLAARIIASHPGMLDVTRQPSITVVDRSTGASQIFQSTNQLAGRPDFLGGKTGTTPEAGENLLALFSYEGHPVMMILLGSENRFPEALELYKWFSHDFIPGN